MASAEEWAYILQKLGAPYKKKAVIDWIANQAVSQEDIWNHYIQSNSLLLKAANASKLYSAEDIDWYFRQVSYARMRGTFPNRSHGRSIIGPGIISVHRLAEEEYQQKKQSGNLTEADIPIPQKLVKSRIVHNKFGPGTIKKLNNNGIITGESLTR